MLEKAYDFFLATLSNRNRLKIIEFLRKGPRNVTQIQKGLKLNQTTLSHNLSRLERCGFVSVAQDGRRRLYSLNKQTIEPLMKLIDIHTERFCKQCIKGKRG